MKKSGFKRSKAKWFHYGKTPQKPLKRTKLRLVSDSTVATLKKDIQATVRAIVIARDGGCLFRNSIINGQPHICSGWDKEGNIVLQADHLITRENTATYGDTQLIVCICKGLHGWKSVPSADKTQRNAEYERVTKSLIGKKRAQLWDKMNAERHRTQTHYVASDWKLIKIALGKELAEYEQMI